jgi:predicted SprT family Zn-dependent metalloprotease
MNVISVIKLANELMNEHGLYQKGWRFGFDSAKRRFGCCNHTHKRISLSRSLASINTEARVRNTILHEIAHALVGSGHGHDNVWRQKAIEIGCDGERCYNTDDVNTPSAPYTAYCDGCGTEYKRHRMPKHNTSCGKCSNKYDERYKLKFIKS